MVKLTHKDRYQDLLATISLLFLLSLLVFFPFAVHAQEKGVEWGPYLTVEPGAGLVLNWKTFPSVYSEVDYDEQWYSFVYGDAQFIFLDSNAGEMGLGSFLEQKRWLKEQLEGCSRPIKVVIFHHPIFSSKYSKGVDIGLANSWHKLFKEYGVDLVFSGHIHSYERSEKDGITYIVAGGGGGPPGNLQSRFDFSQRVVTHTLHYMRVMVRKNEVTVQMIKVADLEEGAGKWTCDDKIVVNREVMDEVSFKY